MQVTHSLQNNMSIKWARPAEENICCSLKLFLHMHNLELQFLEKNHTTSTFWLATSKLKLAFPTKESINVPDKNTPKKVTESILSSFMIPANEKWQNWKIYRKSFFIKKIKILQGAKRYSLSIFSPPPTPPHQHICVKKKNNLYKQNITTDKASLCIKALKHFIAPSGRARAACCSSLTCYTHTYSPWPRNRIQVMPGGQEGPVRDVGAKVEVPSHRLRCDISVTIHKMPTVRTRRYITSQDVGRTSWTFPLRSPARGMQVLKPRRRDPIKIKGLAGLLFLRLGQTKVSHKYQKASNMQIHTAKNQNIYPTPACWRI